jgi:hypothetical protein
MGVDLPKLVNFQYDDVEPTILFSDEFMREVEQNA